MLDITLTDDQEQVLLVAYKALGHSDDLPHKEKIELALSALIDSFDSSLDATEEQEEAGEPISQEQLRAAVERTLSPDISVAELTVASIQSEVGNVSTPTFESFEAEEPNNHLIVEAKIGDEFDRTAVAVTFSHFPKSEWQGAQVADLVHRAAKMLREKNGVDKG